MHLQLQTDRGRRIIGHHYVHSFSPNANTAIVRDPVIAQLVRLREALAANFTAIRRCGF